MKKVTITTISTIILSLLMCFSTVFAQSVEISTGTKEVSVVSVPLNENYKVHGATAENTLGKKTGTLEEFSQAMATDNTVSSVTFPANFFHAYDDTQEVVGGIYSQGELINDSWFDYGCGFDANNNFYLFNLESLVSANADNKIIIKDKDGKDVEIVTAFNCYPQLIKDGVNLPIEPTPGADEKYLNGKVFRAFMGQKEDGTFLYGTVSGVNMYELQEICQGLGLVNAVNVDGGASAGVYQNGGYVVQPGRELASVVYIEEQKSPTTDQQPPTNDTTEVPDTSPDASISPTTTPNASSNEEIKYNINYNNVPIDFKDATVKNIDGRTMAPARYMGDALGATTTYDEATKTGTFVLDGITVKLIDGDKNIYINGVPKEMDVSATIIDGRFYVPPRYLAEAFGKVVAWDDVTNTVNINDGI